VSEAVAIAAAGVWGVGALASALAALLWLRAGRRWLGLVGLGGVLVVEVAGLGWVAARGVDVLHAARSGGIVEGWIEWTAGIAGLVALGSGLAGAGGVRDPDRAAEISVGLFGLGILLRQLASVV
jgi:hypothetical protein